MGALAAAAKLLLKKLVIDSALDAKKRNKLLTIAGSIAVGFLFLLFAPIAVLSTMTEIEPPSYSDIQFDREAFLSQLPPDRQEQITDTESDLQAISDAMSAIGLQEQIIKAQLIYMSFFDENRLADFTAYAEHFTQDDERLIQNLNADYGITIDCDEFMRTYVLVMNSTVNEYMFRDPAEKNSSDLAAWCRNAYVSGWGYADNCIGERTGDDRIRCADNVGLIMGYIRYDTGNKVFTDDTVDMYYTVQGGIETMPDVPGVGVYNGTDFGVYVGDGQVIFSSAMGGCVQRQALYEGGWISWCTFDAVTYPQEVQDRIDEMQSTEEETTENGE